MRVDEYLDAMRDLPLASLPTITGGKPLILAPHPDDESLGCGGLIAESYAQGEAPLVVVLTDGAASHPNSRAYPPDRLRTTREAETRAAVACLGLPADQVTFLRTPDTRAPTDGPAFAEVVSRLTVLIQRHACRSILASWAQDPHCDHQAAPPHRRRRGARDRGAPSRLPHLGPDAAGSHAAGRSARRGQAGYRPPSDCQTPGDRLPRDANMAASSTTTQMDSNCSRISSRCSPNRPRSTWTSRPDPPHHHDRARLFRGLYTADPDPWRFASSPYEAEKYAATLAACRLPLRERA